MAAMALLVTGSVQAAFIDTNEVIVNILRDGVSGDSMLINTGIDATAIGTGGLTNWSSDGIAGLTSAINGFISGASSVSFWVVGKYASGFDKFALSDIALGDATAVNAFFDSNLPAYVDTANADSGFSAATYPWLAGIPSTSDIHYTESNLYGNSLVNGIPMNSSSPFVATKAGFGTFGTESLLNWSLASDGTLSYGAASAVPVPAAVWLFGSGLVGLVGVARRRKA
jgi:hypothetical protein